MQKTIGLPSDDEEVQLNVLVPSDDKAFIKRLSNISNKSMSRIIHEIIEQQKNIEESPNIYNVENAPSFLFTNTATNEELYSYLKENPSASRFIFKKYTANQSFLKELVDPENPIYLEEVANNLRDLYQIKDEHENIQRLLTEKGNLNKEISKLQEEIKSVENEYDEIHDNLEKIRKEDEEYNRQRANIRTDKGLEMLEQNMNDIINFQKNILEKWNKHFKENPTAFGMTIDKNEIKLMDNINRQLKEMMDKIHTEDFLSPENLDKYHRELFEKVQKEKQNALNEMNAFMAHNPKRVLNKILDYTNVCVKKISGAPDDGAGGFYINKLTGGMIVGNLQESMKLTNHLLDQIENKERR